MTWTLQPLWLLFAFGSNLAAMYTERLSNKHLEPSCIFLVEGMQACQKWWDLVIRPASQQRNSKLSAMLLQVYIWDYSTLSQVFAKDCPLVAQECFRSLDYNMMCIIIRHSTRMRYCSRTSYHTTPPGWHGCPICYLYMSNNTHDAWCCQVKGKIRCQHRPSFVTNLPEIRPSAIIEVCCMYMFLTSKLSLSTIPTNFV